MRRASFKAVVGRSGFTLLELIIVMVCMGILAIIFMPKDFLTFDKTKVDQASLSLTTHIRLTQSNAMQFASTWGVRCNGTNYWMFNGTNYNDSANRRPLPGETSALVNVAAKDVTITGFTLFFSAYGIPYTDGGLSTAVSTVNPVNVLISAGSSSDTLSIEPQTGYVR